MLLFAALLKWAFLNLKQKPRRPFQKCSAVHLCLLQTEHALLSVLGTSTPGRIRLASASGAAFTGRQGASVRIVIVGIIRSLLLC